MDRSESKKPIGLIIGLSMLAILMLISCSWAEYFVLDAAISKGMGTSKSMLPSVFSTGLAFAAPIQSAFLMALLPTSIVRRIAISSLWMAFVMIAFSLGVQKNPAAQSPALFSSRVFFSLPLFALGWFIPFGFLRHLRGWQLNLVDEIQPSTKPRLTTASLMGITFVVSIALCCLQFGPDDSYMFGLIILLVGVILGVFLAPAVFAIMKTRPTFSLAIYLFLGVSTYVVTLRIMLLAGAGNFAYSNALILSTLVLSILLVFLFAKICGVTLQTGFQNS